MTYKRAKKLSLRRVIPSVAAILLLVGVCYIALVAQL